MLHDMFGRKFIKVKIIILNCFFGRVSLISLTLDETCMHEIE